MERYEAYKDSGVEWIGEIPKGWRVAKLKHLATIQTGGTPSKDEKNNYYSDHKGIPWIKAENLGLNESVKHTAEYITEAGRAVAKIMPQNSVFVCCIASIGKVGFSEMECSCNQQINAIQFSGLYWKYGYYLTIFHEEQYTRLACGNVVPILNTEKQSNIECIVPSAMEQRAIADFLDEKTAEIDEIVSETERSIELLREYRKSVISEAVTKGLDPNAPMKDSGVEWIGEIPETWRMKRTRYFVSSFRKGFGITKDEVSDEGDIFCVRYGEIYSKYNEKIVEIQSKTLKETIAAPQRIVKGNLLFACTGELVDEIGKNVLFDSDYPCLAGGDIIVADHEQNPGFLNYSLGSYVAQCQKSFGKAKLKVVHITANELGNIRMPIPPLSEQQSIANYLDAKTAEIDALIANKERQVELLKEYRKSLISEAVTGKFKVPGVS